MAKNIKKTEEDMNYAAKSVLQSEQRNDRDYTLFTEGEPEDLSKFTLRTETYSNIELSAPAGTGAVARIEVSFAHTLRDRYEGRRFVERIMRAKPNAHALAHWMRSSSVRDELVEYFMGRRVAAVVTELYSGYKTLILPSDLRRPAEVANAVVSVGGAGGRALSAEACLVITELLVPVLISCGLMTESDDQAVSINYGIGAVTVEGLLADAVGQEVTRVMLALRTPKLTPAGRYAPSVVAQDIATSMIDVGLAFTDMNAFGSILDDIVTGIRVAIDPQMSLAANTTVPVEWRTHSVVQELAQNLPFVEAALRRSVGAHGGLALKNTLSRLEKYAPRLLLSLRSSARYAMVGRAEARATFNLAKMRTVEGRVCHAMLHRNAQVYKTGQAVLVYDDDLFPNAKRLSPVSELLVDNITAAYDRPEGMSLKSIANTYKAVVEPMFELGWTPGLELAFFDVIDPTIGSRSVLRELAALSSLRVVYRVGQVADSDVFDRIQAEHGRTETKEGMTVPIEGSIIISDEESRLVAIPEYEVETREREFHGGWAYAGRFLGDRFVTPSVSEAFFAMPEFEATTVMPEREQVLPKDAFNCSLTGLDTQDLVTIKKRMSFKTTLGGVGYFGSFYLDEIASLKSSAFTNIVVPSFNRSVLHGVTAALGTLRSNIARADKSGGSTGAGSAMLLEDSRRRAAMAIADMARSVSKRFRSEVHKIMMDKAVANMDYQQSVRARGLMSQRGFAGYADAFAFIVFLEAQGIASPALRALFRDPLVQKEFFLYGTDRIEK